MDEVEGETVVIERRQNVANSEDGKKAKSREGDPKTKGKDKERATTPVALRYIKRRILWVKLLIATQLAP